jgi:hypothetical protein
MQNTQESGTLGYRDAARLARTQIYALAHWPLSSTNQHCGKLKPHRVELGCQIQARASEF